MLTNKEMAIFTDELEVVLSSGMNLIEGLKTISENQKGTISKVAKDLYEKLEEGYSITELVTKSADYDIYFKKMIEVGEINGNLDGVCGQLSTYYKREDELKTQIKQTLTYPLILVMMMVAIVSVLIFKILPIFESVMNKMGISFTGVSLIINKFAKVLVVGTLILLCVVLVTAIVCYISYKKNNNDGLVRKVLSIFPLGKKLFEAVNIAKTTYVISLFVNSGYPLEDIVQNLIDINDETELKNKLSNIKNKVENGETFVEALISENIYKGDNASILAIGLRAGKQEETFNKLVNIYDNEVNNLTGDFLNVIEPTIVAVLSATVGIILVSIMLPLIRIMSSM